MATSILAAPDAALGNILLGVVPAEEYLIEATSDLVAFYKCDDWENASTLVDSQGGYNAALTTGSGNTTMNYGVDEFCVTLPNATPAVSPPPYTKVTTNHSYYEHTGADIPITTTGSIEVWFNPGEFGDEKIVPNSGPTTPEVWYDIIRLFNPSTQVGVSIRAATNNPNGQPCFALSWGVDNDLTSITNMFGYYGIQSGGQPFIQTAPQFGPNSGWRYLVLAWDGTTVDGYMDGVHYFNSGTSDVYTTSTGIKFPPTLGGAANFKIGDCGGRYDLITIVGRKLSASEVLLRYNTSIFASTSYLRATNIFVNYAASYQRNLRVTNQRNELLRTGNRNLRVTKQYTEILRSVSFGGIGKNVRDTLTFTQTATGTTASGAMQSLAFMETLSYTLNQVYPTLQTLAFTQTVSTAGSTFYVNVNQTLTFTQTISLIFIVNPTQVLNFTDSVSAYATNGADQTLAFTQTALGYTGNPNDPRLTQSLTDHLVFSQMAWCNGYYGDFPISNSLDYTLGDLVLAGPGDTNSFSTDFLAFEETVTKLHIHNMSVSQTLSFNQTVGKQAILSLPVNQTLEFIDGFIETPTNIFIGGKQVIIPIPTLIVTVVNNSDLYVLLRSPTGVIVLPTPEWADTDEGGSTVDVKRSMTGKVYTYVRTANWHKIHYDFTLSRIKSLEFRKFLMTNLSNVLYLTNWKGEQYVGQIIQNPTSLVGAARYSTQYEKYTMAFDFEGVLLYG